jgi:hypothetical protein
MRALLLLSVSWALAPSARAQAVPRRQIPPTVLSELALLEQRFEQALAADCHPDRCWSKGCAYVDHAVLDRPRAASLPGLADGAGPGSVEPQEFLTQATCAFAYEPAVPAADAEALGRRLQSKVSHGFTVVSVSRQELQPLAPELEQPLVPPAPEAAPEPPAPPPPRWSASLAARELWTELLPHAAWMIAVVLLTAAATALVWAWRRVGRETLEERALLAQLAREDGTGADAPAPEVADETDAQVAAIAAAWRERLAAATPDAPDPELQALARELLRDRDLPTLAKAVLEFPAAFVASFPSGGDVAAGKLALADYVKTVDPAELPSDEVFWSTLSRVSRAAALASQGDARLIRSLREDFGAPGLVALTDQVSPRAGALLFALAPADEQAEMVRLLGARAPALAEQLLRSNRMDDAESSYLFALVEAARAGGRLPAPPPGEVSERGTPFDAPGALSVLLAALAPSDRAAVMADAVARYHGALPAWLRGLLYPDLLLAIPEQARADLFLEVDAALVSAWLATLDEDARTRLLAGMPRALRASLDAAPAADGRERQLAAAASARGQLARGLQRQLVRAGLSFEQVVAAPPGAST